MPTRAELKANAKQALTGKWGKGVLIVLCYLIVCFGLCLLNMIPFIGGIAMFVLEIPIMLGITFSFIKLKRGENVGAFDFVILGFQNFKRSWCIFGSILLKMIAPIIASVVIMIVAMIGGATAIVGSMKALGGLSGSASGNFSTNTFKGNYSFNYGDYDYDYDYGYDFSDVSYTTNPYARSSTYSSSSPYSSDYYSASIDTDRVAEGAGLALGSLAILGVVMIAMFIVSIWSLCKSLLYALTYYIAYDNPNMTAKEAAQTSENLMRGNRGKFFVLQLSFIGWSILASITFGIGYFWLIPYMVVTFICFYEALASRNNGNNGNYNTNNTNNMNYANNNGMNSMNYNNGNVINGNTMNSQYNDMNQSQNMNNVIPQNTNQAPEVTEYVPVNFEPETNQSNQPAPAQNVNSYNPVTPEPTVNPYNPVTPEPTVNQYNPVTPEPTVNPYNPVTPEQNTNQYNQANPTADANQFNPINNDFNNPNNNNM